MGLLRLLWPKKDLATTGPDPEQLERWLVEGFRVLGRLCTQMADRVESQRLQRVGYPPSERFLERLGAQEPANAKASGEAPPLRNAGPNASSS